MTSGEPVFARRVAGVLATRVLQFASTIAVAFLLARLLGPEGRGAYSLLLLLPSTLFALAQFGLPSAATYYAGSGRSLPSLMRIGAGATIVLSLVLIPLTLLVLPAIEKSVFGAAPGDLLRFALVAFPLQVASSLFGSMLWGRQLVRRYGRILVAQSVGSLLAVLLLVGAAGLDVTGALVAQLLVTALSAAAVILTVRGEARREASDGTERPGVRVGEMLAYGIRLYPAGLSTFLSYRSDLFLLGLLLGDAEQIGLYALAVSLAEITFHVPDAIATILYPRVAASERADANALAPSMSRFTILVTVIAALALIPTAIGAVRLLLPAYGGSVAPFLVLVPAAVSLSVSKVLSGYVSGLGLPLPVGAIAVVALAVNIVSNVILIPRLGIEGAALSSLISYSFHAALTTALAGRLAGAPLRAFLLPGRAELSRLVGRLGELAARRRRPAG